MKFIAEEISQETYISLMSQYHPYYRASKFPAINRRIFPEEYKAAKDVMEHYGLHNGWTQESGGLDALAGVHLKKKQYLLFFRNQNLDRPWNDLDMKRNFF